MSAGRIADIEGGLRAFRDAPGAVLMDVRTPEEYAAGHIPGSVNVPLDRLWNYNGDADAPVFVYCRSGARSAQACALLQQMDYEAVNIGGVEGYRGELER